MATLIFSLRNVPFDEAEDIRQLLHAHHLEFYETSAGNWGISTPAIWLVDEHDLTTAQELIATYQQEKSATQRALYEAEKRAGKQRRIVDIFIEQPLQFIIYICFSLLILYISYRLLLDLGF